MASFAQVKFSTIVNEKQPSIDEVVQVEYAVENAKSVDKIEMPSFSNFRVVQGPIQSNGMSYMNGVLSKYKSITFILQPLLKGRLVVPGTTAIIDGKAMRSEPVAIQVSNSGRRPGRGNTSPGVPRIFPEAEPEVNEEYILKPGESMTDKIKNNLFVRTDVNKTTCYEGEPIVATFKLFSRLKSESRVLKRPSLNGFSVYDMVEPEANVPTVETINGKLFNAHLIRQTQLFPLQAGTFIIDPVELDNTVKFIRTKARERESLTPMEQLMEEFSNEGVRGEVEEHTFSLASKPVTITVKPLPLVNKPASFNGAVGKFTMQAEIKAGTVEAGEEIALQVKIEGKGNFTVINAPQVLVPPGMEGYDPAVKENVDKSIYPLSGSKTFDYTFVVRDTGSYLIPSIAFSYFDPADARYKTDRSDSFTIRVIAAPQKNEGLQNTKSDKSATDSSSVHNLPGKTLVAAVAIVLLLFGLFLWLKTRKDEKAVKMNKPVNQIPEAKLLDTDPFEAAKFALLQEKSKEFYNEINKAIWLQLSEKINIPSTELNKFNVSARLHSQGIDRSTIDQLQALLNECEIALYTPVHSTQDMKETLATAESLLSHLRRSLT